MVIVFEIVLLTIILFSFLGIVGELENKEIRETMLTLFIASTAAFIASVTWL